MTTTLTPSQFTSPGISPIRHPAPRPPAPDPPGVPVWPTWGQRILPTPLRGLLIELGLWQDPTPLVPSQHLDQVLVTLTHYGWCKSLDYSPTGRMCIRGAQNLLEKTGHVTPAGRARAADHMQTVLARTGVTMPFFAWNDLPDQQFSAVEQLLTQAATLARQNGE